MLAQTWPMTTLAVVNVDSVGRPAALGVQNGRGQARSCKIAKSNARLVCRSFVRTGGRSRRVHDQGDRQGKVGRSALGRPGSLAGGTRQESPFWPNGVPVDIRSRKNTQAKAHAAGQLDSAQDHRSTAKLEPVARRRYS